MARVLMMCGKGGVGKTTVAAATAAACAQRGHRTLIISFDLAHNLSDAFDVGQTLFDQNRGRTRRVADNLDIQEIDVHQDLQRNWQHIQKFTASFMASTGMSDIVAEELGVLPGMEDLIALLYINRYVDEGTYDVVVVDCPPTAEALRFVGTATALSWYARKRLRVDRTLMRLTAPIAKHVSDAPLPPKEYFDEIEQLTQQLQGVDRVLMNPRITTVRMVTNAEKIVVKETQRAYMYFNMYGIVTDTIIINRVFPEGDGYLKHWAERQVRYMNEIDEHFSPVPVKRLPLLEDEVIGIDEVRKMGQMIYGSDDPASFFVEARPHTIEKDGGGYVLRVRMPFVDKAEAELSRADDDLLIRVGSFQRHVALPRTVARLQTGSARFNRDELEIRFVEANS